MVRPHLKSHSQFSKKRLTMGFLRLWICAYKTVLSVCGYRCVNGLGFLRDSKSPGFWVSNRGESVLLAGCGATESKKDIFKLVEENYDAIITACESKDTEALLAMVPLGPALAAIGPPDRWIEWFESPLTPHHKQKTQKSVRLLRSLVARQGLEPWTHALKGRCSTN